MPDHSNFGQQDSKDDWTRELRVRLAPLRLAPEREAAIIEELSQHLDDRWRELVAAGAEPEEATRLVLGEFTDRDRLANRLAALQRARASDKPAIDKPAAGMWTRGEWRADVRDACRAIRRAPLQTATIVVSLTIATTLVVLMFGVVNAMVAGRIAGIRERGRLVRLAVEHQRARNITMGEFRRLPSTVPGLQSIGGELSWRFSASIGGRAVPAEGMFVTGTYFGVLGTSPPLGRLIARSDDRPGAAPVVVIGHELWRREFGGRPDAIGTSIRIGTGAYEVIGVLPPRFTGLDGGDFGETSDERSQLWLPMQEMWAWPDYRAAQVEGAVGPRIVGRLEPLLSPASAEAQAQTILPALAPSGRGASPGTPADAGGLAFERGGDRPPRRLRFRPLSLLPSSNALQTTLFISVLMSVPLIVLAIASINVGGIQLARAAGRTHDLAVRMSLGASRLRVARLIAIETALLAFAAGALAWIVATWALRFAGDVLPFAVIPDERVFAFAMVLSLGVTLAAGLAPAWRATGIDVVSGLRLGAGVGRMAGPRLRRAIVIGQISLSVLLLVVATLLIRSLASLGWAVGTLQEEVLVADLAFADLALDVNRALQIRTTIGESLARLPGVEDTAVSSSGLFGSATAVCWADPNDTSLWSGFAASRITPGYFRTLGIRMLRGRGFTTGDRDGVVVVNEAFVASLLKGTTPLGAPVRIVDGGSTRSERAEVIGVVEDSYERVPRGRARPRCYVPMDPSWAGSYFTIFARSQATVALAPRVQEMLSGVDPRLSARGIGTVAERVRAEYRWLYWITDGLTIVSLIALVLAAVGLFALMAYSVSQRTKEFGVRLALGARPRDVASDVMRESLMMTLAGTAVGLLGAIPVATVLGDSVLATISLRDPVAAAAVTGLLIAVAAIATLAPASRVFRLDPIRALRKE